MTTSPIRGMGPAPAEDSCAQAQALWRTAERSEPWGGVAGRHSQFPWVLGARAGPVA